MHGFKVNIRIYYILSCINNYYSYSILDYLEIITAKEQYKNKDYYNTNIHDTHLINTEYFIDELKLSKYTYNKIINQIKIILKACFNIVKKDIKLYNHSKNGYEIFGCNFIIDSDYNVFLLEINDHVGFNYPDDGNNNSKDIFVEKKIAEWVYKKQ